MSYHALIKTPTCQLACSYCFDASRRERTSGAMSDATLEALTAERLRTGGEVVEFAWQGGEPTLAGLDFFRRAQQLQREHARPGQTVTNAITTNGLRISDEWARWLARNRWLVGLSLDGPEHVHDRHRVTPRGQGTHSRAVAALARLLDAGADVNVMACVTDYSAPLGGEVYDYLTGLGARWLQFLPIVGAPGSVSGAGYGEFLCAVLERWRADTRGVRVRIFDHVESVLAGGPPGACTHAQSCGRSLAIDHEGSIYPCDHATAPGQRLGGIEDGILSALTGARWLGDAKRDLHAECKACPVLRLCWGGCPLHRDESGRNALCEGYRAIFGDALKWRGEAEGAGR